MHAQRNPLLAVALILSLPGSALTAAETATKRTAQPPRTVGEIFDGTLHDIAATRDKVWLAQGRNVAILDSETGKRTVDDRLSPYPKSLVAMEYEKNSETLIVATTDSVYVHLPNGNMKTWSEEQPLGIVDIKTWPATEKIFLIRTNVLSVLDYSSATIEKISEIAPPPQTSYFLRLRVAEVDGKLMAYVIAQIASQQRRWQQGLVIVDLDRGNGYATPRAYANPWNPIEAYGTPQATVWDVQVIPNLVGDDDYAYVACGKAGQLTKLNITDAANPKSVAKIDLAVDSDGDGRRDYDVFKVLKDPDKDRLYVASANLIHIVDLETDRELGSQNVGFYNAGDRDVALIQYPDGRRHLWTATHHQVPYAIKCIDVTADVPTKLLERWWISSSDGAVAVPEWDSVYLPTFGGVVRYDVSDGANPVAVDDSYQPAKGTTEHIEIMWPDPEDREHALILTAPGNGGVQYYRASADDRNPGPPTKVVEKPEKWGADPVYQNDVAFYQRDGVNYLLADLANRRTHEVALQAYNMSTGLWVNAFESNPDIKANSKDIYVFRDLAFVTCHGGFFVVRLDMLPERMDVVDEVVARLPDTARPKTVASVVANPDGTHLFVATDGPGEKVIYSCPFNARTGQVGEPLSVLSGPDIPGSTAHVRYHDAADRFYVASRKGQLLEIDASDPTNLMHLSTWNNGGYFGEMQDCTIYDFGRGPRILAVKNNEGFAILDPDDGL